MHVCVRQRAVDVVVMNRKWGRQVSKWEREHTRKLQYHSLFLDGCSVFSDTCALSSVRRSSSWQHSVTDENPPTHTQQFEWLQHRGSKPDLLFFLGSPLNSPLTPVFFHIFLPTSLPQLLFPLSPFFASVMSLFLSICHMREKHTKEN